MLTGIDHLVIAVPDLADGMKRYAALGFTVVPGGRHPTGSHNALIAFRDGSYLELLAFYQPSPEHKWWAVLQQGGGLIDVCMQTDDQAGDARAWRAAGVAMQDPAPLSRQRPDGYLVRWMLASCREPHRGVAPFLIQDETPRDERVPRQHEHPNGVTGIGTLTIAVDDLAGVRGWYARALGKPGIDVARDDLGAAGARFTIGPHAVEILAPRGAGGPLRTWLDARGPSPYAATLLTTGTPAVLDEARTLGARLALVRAGDAA